MYDIVIKLFLDYSKINYETDTLTLYGIKFKKTTPNVFQQSPKINRSFNF